MTRLYDGYRNQIYLKQRQAWEPTYTPALNSDLGHEPSVVRARHEILQRALASAALGARKINCAVDIGGDRGQFIPDSIQRRFVLEVSGRTPIDGVGSVDSHEAARRVRPDLVMACGILEHVSNPAAFLDAIQKQIAAGREILIYVEVPAGVPDVMQRQHTMVSRLLARVACRVRPLWRWLDRQSAQHRTSHGSEFPLMPLRQSEHLNFFTTEGLQALIGRCGWEALVIDEYAMPAQLTKGGRIAFTRVIRSLSVIPAQQIKNELPHDLD